MKLVVIPKGSTVTAARLAKTLERYLNSPEAQSLVERMMVEALEVTSTLGVSRVPRVRERRKERRGK